MLKWKEEEDAYLLHLKDLHSTHEEMGQGKKQKKRGKIKTDFQSVDRQREERQISANKSSWRNVKSSHSETGPKQADQRRQVHWSDKFPWSL